MAFYFRYNVFMKLKSFLIELLKTVLTSIVIVFILVHFILMPCMVQGSSMKRVIGLPNEKISFVDNKLYVNDEYVEEPFLTEDTETRDFEVVLGDDEYFCMGDNRSVSRDSRYYGAFSSKDILSTKLFVIYPFNDFGMH